MPGENVQDRQKKIGQAAQAGSDKTGFLQPDPVREKDGKSFSQDFGEPDEDRAEPNGGQRKLIGFFQPGSVNDKQIVIGQGHEKGKAEHAGNLPVFQNGFPV